MNQVDIKQLVENLIANSFAGMEIENQKVDFKRKWYNLKSAAGKNEFIKDTSAIVNTIGPDGFIIIGFDEKDKSYHSSTFKNSKLRDSSDLNGIITKSVSYPYEVNVFDEIINGNKISIIHIPPSIEKPHVIKLYKKIRGRKTTQYQNQIFVRKGTITTTANRYDLELMNYDRKNLNKPYQTHIFLRGFRDIALSPNKITSKVWLTIENLGFRPLAICQMKLNTKLSNKDVLHFKSTKLKSLEGARQNSDLITNPVVANPNTIVGLAIEFVTEKRVTGLNQDIFNTEKDKLKEVNGEILLTTNNKIYFDVIQSNSLND